MKKRFLSVLLAGVLMLLAACGGHTHSTAGDWDGDSENHWHACECGEKMDLAAHTLENDICTVCGSEIVTYEDGSMTLSVYNQKGDCTRYVGYTAEGDVEFEERFEYTYDGDGNRLSQKRYSGEMLSSEYEYALGSSGETYLARETYYYEDGSKDINEYDENWNTLSSRSYAADGSVNYAYEYEYSEEAGWMREKAYEGDRLISEQESILDGEGWQIIIRYVSYNEDGSFSVTEYDEHENETLEATYDADGKLEYGLRYENEYDADGNRTLRRTYENERLTEEMEFLFGSDEDGSWSMSGKTTTYHEDGTRTVSDSDPEGSWSSEITYAADGSGIEELRYEYLEDENGESIGSKGYRNGKLFQEVQTIVDENGEATGTRWIDYEEDGTMRVSEYDEYFDLVKETVYDAAGNIVSESE